MGKKIENGRITKKSRWEMSAYGKVAKVIRKFYLVLCKGEVKKRAKPVRRKPQKQTVEVNVRILGPEAKFLEIEPKAK